MLDEHEIISSADQSVQLLDRYWEISEEGFVKHVQSLIRFFREYSDKYHHYKEEQVLFPALENHIDFLVNSMISELNEHHEIFREFTKAIEEHINKNQFEKAYTKLSLYMDELLDHIAAEDDELFVMAVSLLSGDELESMYYKFRDIDIDLGEDRKVKLCNMLKDIEEEIRQN